VTTITPRAPTPHAPGRHGAPLVQGKRVAGFTDSEEAAVGLSAVVPFSIEQRYRELGARYEKVGDVQPHAVRDGKLITGQNPPSSAPTAQELLAALRG
jgi:putative intracellular protease/amidase